MRGSFHDANSFIYVFYIIVCVREKHSTIFLSSVLCFHPDGWHRTLVSGKVCLHQQLHFLFLKVTEHERLRVIL